MFQISTLSILKYVINKKKLQVHYASKVLVLVLLFNKTKSLAFKMKIFQLYQDLKVLYILLTWSINIGCSSSVKHSLHFFKTLLPYQYYLPCMEGNTLELGLCFDCYLSFTLLTGKGGKSQ